MTDNAKEWEEFTADLKSPLTRAFEEKWFGRYPQFNTLGLTLNRRVESLRVFLEGKTPKDDAAELAEFDKERKKADNTAALNRAFEEKWFGRYPQFNTEGISLFRRSEALRTFLHEKAMTYKGFRIVGGRVGDCGEFEAVAERLDEPPVCVASGRYSGKGAKADAVKAVKAKIDALIAKGADPK